jgi:hypothetical protein
MSPVLFCCKYHLNLEKPSGLEGRCMAWFPETIKPVIHPTVPFMLFLHSNGCKRDVSELGMVAHACDRSTQEAEAEDHEFKANPGNLVSSTTA